MSLEVNLYNSNEIKLQGICYYSDCYKFWDLNLCENNFKSAQYEEIVSQIKEKRHVLWNGKVPMAVIPLAKFDRSYDKYLATLSKNVRRDIGIAQKKGFYFKQYDFNNYVPDFVEINQSQLERNHRKHEKINPWYLQSSTAFRGMHTDRQHPWQNEHHYSTWYGVFKHLKHYKQDEKITNEKLTAYCKIAVDGDLAVMTLLWAHTRFLRDGIMFYIVSELVRELVKYPNVKHIVYYSANQFPGWKKRMLFEPACIRATL